MPANLDLGIVVEGVVELDPITERMVLRYEDKKGVIQFVDIQERLEAYRDQEVRFIVTPLATVARLGEMVDKGELKLEHVSTVPKLG